MWNCGEFEFRWRVADQIRRSQRGAVLQSAQQRTLRHAKSRGCLTFWQRLVFQYVEPSVLEPSVPCTKRRRVSATSLIPCGEHRPGGQSLFPPIRRSSLAAEAPVQRLTGIAARRLAKRREWFRQCAVVFSWGDESGQREAEIQRLLPELQWIAGSFLTARSIIRLFRSIRYGMPF